MMHSKLTHFSLFLACFSLSYSIVSDIYVSMPNVFPVLHSGLQFILITVFISLLPAVQFYLDIWVVCLMIFALQEDDDDYDDDDEDEEEDDEENDEDESTEDETDQPETTTESETQKGN